ncbi:hypothetical protein [Methylobacterium radiodurans]|uniref:Uncharacterized protein n=1 Tax=Methylobacterium radiodurans TaxID=2202828 RepID=A0A2U8VRL8_9HYPH|nr:hypothetical protein [Methylobacterium radiodurans]AWN36347.1 hypothetical protein DK427_11935 [Methylobacterium radiodurans]
MSTRSIIVTAAIATGVTASASAQDGRTFQTWGHTFSVPGSSTDPGAVANPVQDADRSDAPRRTYVSGQVDPADARKNLAPATTSQVINVWGARVEVPAR